MLLLYRIYTILSSISGIVHFSEYDGLHKYQTYGTFRMFRMSGTFQTFQTTPMPGFSAAVPIFQRQKVDHRRLYCVCEKLTAAEEGTLLPPRSKATYIYNIYSIFPPFSYESVQPRSKRRRSQTGTPQAKSQGHSWAQHAIPSRPQMRLQARLTHTESSPLQVTSSQLERRCGAFLRLIDAFYDV